MKRGRETEEQSGEHRRAECEAKDAPIHREAQRRKEKDAKAKTQRPQRETYKPRQRFASLRLCARNISLHSLPRLRLSTFVQCLGGQPCWLPGTQLKLFAAQLFEDLAQRNSDGPAGIVSFETTQVADVADVIAGAIHVDVLRFDRAAKQLA
jgi:hypothetical protein